MRAILLAAAAFVLAGAINAAEFTFTLATHVVDDSVISQSFHQFAKDVEEKSNGRLAVNVSTAGALGGQREIVENVNLGAIEMGMGEAGIYTNYVPAFGVMVLPFIFDSSETYYAHMDGAAGQRLTQMLDQKTNMRLIAWLDGGGPRNIYSTKPIGTVQNLRGVKIRTPESPAFVAMFRAFNANPTPISMPEVYTSLQQGVVDAMEGTYETTYTFGITEVAKNCLETGHVYGEVSLVINKDAFNELPADLQEILLDCAKNLEKNERAATEDVLVKFRQRMLDSNVIFTPVDIAETKEMVSGVYADYIGGDKEKQEIFDLLSGK